MTCPADLHTHTTASDGQYTPSQLAAKALAAGIQILAVTDHDTMDGAEEATMWFSGTPNSTSCPVINADNLRLSSCEA